MLWYLCIFFFQFCTPAPHPDVLSFLNIIGGYLNGSICAVLLVQFTVIYFIITLGKTFTSTVYFVPYNIRLNMLCKRRKSSIDSIHFALIYFVFIVALTLEESASIIPFLEYYVLDLNCLIVLVSFIKLNIFILELGIQTVIHIIFNYKKIFHPLHCTHELTATWIFILLLKMSSDVHPNPGPSPLNKEFSSGFLSFCNWNLNTLSKDNFYRISLLEAHNNSTGIPKTMLLLLNLKVSFSILKISTNLYRLKSHTQHFFQVT